MDSQDLLSGMGPDGQGTIKVIRGCPCYKVFGDEKLCVNDDDILEIDAVEVDPALFALHPNIESMVGERATEGNVCYVAIFINYPDNRVYCISQGWKLRIHQQDVPADDLEDALQFLSTKDLTASAEICSECLYKFILTLGDTFSDLLSRQEKTDEIKRYVDKFSLLIAVKHSQMDGMQPIGTEDDVEEGVDHFAFLSGYLIQLKEQLDHWDAIFQEMKKDDTEDWLLNLVERRERLARFEYQFYSQTLLLRTIYDFNLLLKMLKFILRTADEILQLNDEIHSEIRSKRFKEIVEKDPRIKGLESYSEKSRTIEHNFGNIWQILSRL